MSDVPVQLVVAAFNDEKAADAALKELKQAKREKLIDIQVAAVVRRDEKNKLHVNEVGELTAGKGAAGGAILGVALGLITGGTGLVLGAAGALIGRWVGKKHDIGIPNARLEQIGAALKPGSSAIMAVIEHTWVAQVEAVMAEAGAEVLTAAIAADISEQLGADRDVAYTALDDGESLTTGRMAAGEDRVEVSSTSITADAIESSSAVATAEGVVAERLIETAEGLAYEAAAITEDAAAYGAAVITDDVAGVIGASVTMAEDEEETEDEQAEKPDEA